jgi:hypothetical protein
MNPAKNLWPFGLVLAFVLFFIGMASVVVIAATHREHLVNGNYYEQELKFQSQIDAAARAKKAGATIRFDAAAGQLYRPSAPELDREFLLEPKRDGTQTLNLSKFAAGLWEVRVAWTAGGENYYLEQKIKI